MGIDSEDIQVLLSQTIFIYNILTRFSSKVKNYLKDQFYVSYCQKVLGFFFSTQTGGIVFLFRYSSGLL